MKPIVRVVVAAGAALAALWGGTLWLLSESLEPSAPSPPARQERPTADGRGGAEPYGAQGARASGPSTSPAPGAAVDPFASDGPRAVDVAPVARTGAVDLQGPAKASD